MFVILSLALTVVMVPASTLLTELMHAPKEAFGDTVWYVAICSAGTVFIVAYNLVGSIFRGIGDSKIPLLTVAIACVLNILGDLLLVAVCGWGAAGAALATVFAQAVSVVLSLAVSWAMSQILPVSLFRIGLATPVTSAVQIVMCLGFFLVTQWRKRKRR